MSHTRSCADAEGPRLVCRLGLTMTNLSTTFDVLTFTYYDDTKGNAKCQNWRGFSLL